MTEIVYCVQFHCGLNPTYVGSYQHSAEPVIYDYFTGNLFLFRLRAIMKLTGSNLPLHLDPEISNWISRFVPVKELQQLIFEYATFSISISLHKRPAAHTRDPVPPWTETSLSKGSQFQNIFTMFPPFTDDSWNKVFIINTYFYGQLLWESVVSILKTCKGLCLYLIRKCPFKQLQKILHLEAASPSQWMTVDRDLSVPLKKGDHIALSIQSSEPCECFVQAYLDVMKEN